MPKKKIKKKDDGYNNNRVKLRLTPETISYFIRVLENDNMQKARSYRELAQELRVLNVIDDMVSSRQIFDIFKTEIEKIEQLMEFNSQLIKYLKLCHNGLR